MYSPVFARLLRSGILQYTTNKHRKLTGNQSGPGQSGSASGGGGAHNSTGGGGGGGANDGQGGTVVDFDLVASSGGGSNVTSHRLSGGLDIRGAGYGFGGLVNGGNSSGGAGGGAGGVSGLSGILSHSNNHLFHAMTGRAEIPSGEVQTPPLQRRLAKSFSVAQSSSLQKGHYLKTKLHYHQKPL